MGSFLIEIEKEKIHKVKICYCFWEITSFSAFQKQNDNTGLSVYHPMCDS